MIKCLVWDLDETLWKGTLMEGDLVELKPGVQDILEELTRRGIVNSIASRNDHDSAWTELERLGVDRFFVEPRIDHFPKPENIQDIAKALNISVDSLAFIDNEPFERAAVEHLIPEVQVFDADDYLQITKMPEFDQKDRTEEGGKRIKFYQTETKRKNAESTFAGNREDFLQYCKMELIVQEVGEPEIARVVELAERTNQFNSSGIRYSVEDLRKRIKDPLFRVDCFRFVDRFGESGIIGAMILRRLPRALLIESLMVSCRVDGRGIPGAILTLVMQSLKEADIRLVQVQFHPNQRNRRLLFLYQMMGFQPLDDDNIWEVDISNNSPPKLPKWLKIMGALAD